MKANRPRRDPVTHSKAGWTCALTVLALAGSCNAPRPVPSPTPSPRPAMPALPGPSAAAPQGWQDAPITPGMWRWSMENGQSVARFGDGTLVLRCDRNQRALALARSTGATMIDPAPPVSVTTTSLARSYTGSVQAGTVALSFSASDPMLDAMAFSRGRFAVEVAGLSPVYVPSWPEISRVIEDCR